MDYLYLVLVRCGIEDVPVRIFRDATKAHEFAKQLTKYSPAFAEAQRAVDTLGRETALLDCVDVVRFLNGSPVDFVTIKEF